MDEFIKHAISYLMEQGPWAIMLGVTVYLMVKLVNKIIAVVERNSAAFARVEAVMDKVMEKLNV